MPDSFLDHLGGPEKQRILKRLRSPEAYERLREKVKGPEDLERALDRAERIAELHFALETDRAAHERMKSIVERAVREDPDGTFEADTEIPAAVKEGRFTLAVVPHEETHEDALTVLPEGNVQEKIPVRAALLEECLSQLSPSA